MDNRVGKMRSFIIKFLYYAIWGAVIYVVLQYGMPLFMPFVIAFLIAFILKPLINKIAEKTPLGRKAAAIVVLVLTYLVLGSLLALLGTRIVLSAADWFGDLPTLYNTRIEPVINQIAGNLRIFTVGMDDEMRNFFDMASQSISTAVDRAIGAISSGAINVVTGMATRVPWAVVSTVLSIIASFFFVVDYYRITSFITAQLSPNAVRRLFLIKDFVVNVLFKFARAYLILMSITFVEVSIGLLILRVESPFMIALFVAIVDILPIFGTGTILIPWTIYCLITGDIVRGVGLLVLYLVITFLRQMLEPRVIGNQIGLYPLLTLISMFVGTRLFGFWGLFGFPILLTVIIYLNRIGEIHLFTEPSTRSQPKKSKDDGEAEAPSP